MSRSILNASSWSRITAHVGKIAVVCRNNVNSHCRNLGATSECSSAPATLLFVIPLLVHRSDKSSESQSRESAALRLSSLIAQSALIFAALAAHAILLFAKAHIPYAFFAAIIMFCTAAAGPALYSLAASYQYSWYRDTPRDLALTASSFMLDGRTKQFDSVDCWNSKTVGQCGL
ncbi:hypothetical protein C8F01DRAFT_1084135 [Mycena amicta]|nr:hypothetical protein C8F01DRAFT_1084135 [Mycena amicta]